MPATFAESLRGASSTSSQTQLQGEIERAIEALDARVSALVEPLDGRQRALRGANGGWGIDRILEHLCLASGDYLAAMRRALDRPGAALQEGNWRPTVGGRLLVWSMQSSWRMPAPKAIVPIGEPRAGVLEAFLRGNGELRALLAGAADREWRRVTMTSPYARLVRLNLGDSALVVVRHAERHARQMARIDVNR